MLMKCFGGVRDQKLSELGGPQILINNDFFLDFGQRPDHWSSLYGFPYKPKSFNYLTIGWKNNIIPKIPNIYRHDLMEFLGMEVGENPIKGVLATHGHYDHIGHISLLRHDMPIYMSELTRLLLYAWQYTSGRTVNQFIDMYEQLSDLPDKEGKSRPATGKAAMLPRDIRKVVAGEKFTIDDYFLEFNNVDHSLPGAGSWKIYNDDVRLAFSGDFRFRGWDMGESTRRFIDSLVEDEVTDFGCEGSLLHFDHFGTEEDVVNKTYELIKDRTFVGVAYPPRDVDRIRSMYEAAKMDNRMLLVSPAQAILLMILNGANRAPKMDDPNIGVLMMPKKRGMILQSEHLIDELYDSRVEGDYYTWERQFLEFNKWHGRHSPVPQMVTLDDIKHNQDKFLTYVPFSGLIDLLNYVQPGKGSRYIASHPAPWTTEMEVMEDRTIKILKEHDIYEGQVNDHLYEMYGHEVMRKLHTVHVTGHPNRFELMEEVAARLDPRKTKIIVYHSMHVDKFKECFSGFNVIVPELRQEIDLRYAA